MLLIGIRIHYLDEDHIDWYLENLQNWFLYRNYQLNQSSAGLHHETENHHLHYHCVMESGKVLSKPIATFKYDYEKKKVGVWDKPAVGTIAKSMQFPPSIIGQLYKGRINISIKMTSNDNTEEITKFLQYPLKEMKPIPFYCKNIDIHGLSTDANLVYIASRELHAASQRKKENQSKRELSKWEELTSHLDEIRPSSYINVYREVLIYYRDNYEKPPTVRFMADSAERYCFKKGLLCIDQILTQICRY